MFQFLLAQATSYVSVRGVRGLSFLLEVVPKKPSTSSLAAVVVTDGAVIELLREVKAPLWESIGEVASTPLTSMTAPPADA
jgi:hypothetical protein